MSVLPKSIGKYQVIERIGVGGMAELLKARVVGAGGFEKLVAIKRILAHLASDASVVEMFFDEARLMAQLDHPNIAGVFELGTETKTPYIAMQFVDGLDVLGLLRQSARAQLRLPPELAVFIARSVLDGLDYAHHAKDGAGRSLGIIHRDVSPGNVLLSWRGDVKLTDFGIAQAKERVHKTKAGILKGKYGYMAPEQVSGNELAATTDVFSTGIVLAEMVMARRLFKAANEFDVLLMVRDARLERLHRYADDFPDELLAIVVKALQRRPEDRWASAAAFRDALDEWLAKRGRWTSRELSEFMADVSSTADAEVSIDAATPSVEPDANARSAAPLAAPPAAAVAEGGKALAGATDTGAIRDIPVVKLIATICRERATGLLRLKHPSGAIKEAYVVDGEPHYVHSSVPAERLGAFLAAEGALSAEALIRAEAVINQFGGRLADTLVGLGVLRPLDVYRLLAKQVGAKVIEACSWREGDYVWKAGVASPYLARPLHLEAMKLVGSGAMALSAETVEEWLASNADRRVARSEEPWMDSARFGLGEAPARVLALLDGSTLRELTQRPRSEEARSNLLRVLYLLIHCGLAGDENAAAYQRLP